MILEKQKQSHVLQVGTQNESIGMSLDLDSAQVLMQMLSKNLYSDSIGSTIRECASNALDSHRRLKVDKPIIISLVRNEANNYEFSVEDFGTGLDDDDVRNIISKYGKSTKRDSDTELGMMGLGFKAPLAYTSSFYFIARKDGIERKYMMYEGEEVNSIDLLHTASTKESNGVKVIVPVNWNDRYDFINKIKEQLAYFQNVFFNVDGIDNDFLIHRSNVFQFSELASDRNLHVCLDDVYYPIDFGKLGVDRIELPVGLRFKLSDGLFPTPNRESLIYTRAAKDTLLKRIGELANYCVLKYNEKIEIGNGLKEALSYYSEQCRYINIGDTEFDIRKILQFSTIPIKKPTIDELNLINLEAFCKQGNVRYLLNEYSIRYKLDNDRMYEIKSNHWGRDVRWDSLQDPREPYYLFDESMRGNKKQFIRSICKDRTKFIKKVKSNELGHRNSTGMDTYHQILELKKFPKFQWRDVIKEFQWMINEFINPLPIVDDIEIDQDWLDDKKALMQSKSKVTIAGRAPRIAGDVSCKIAEDSLRYVEGKQCKFVASKINIESIEDNVDTMHIYVCHDDFMKLDVLYNVAKWNNVKLFTVSNRELLGLADLELSNLLSYEQFMEGGSDIFSQLATSYAINSLIGKYPSAFNDPDEIKEIHDALTINLKDLYIYKNKYMPKNGVNYTICAEIFEIAKTKYLMDSSIWGTYTEVSAILSKHYYIDVLISRIHYNNSSSIQKIISDMMKFYNLKGHIPFVEVEL